MTRSRCGPVAGPKRPGSPKNRGLVCDEACGYGGTRVETRATRSCLSAPLPFLTLNGKRQLTFARILHLCQDPP